MNKATKNTDDGNEVIIDEKCEFSLYIFFFFLCGEATRMKNVSFRLVGQVFVTKTYVACRQGRQQEIFTFTIK